MKNLFVETKNSFLLSSASLILFGIVLLFWPTMTGKIVSYTMGVLVLLYGALHLIGFFRKNKDQTVYHYKLIIGFIAMGTGIFVLIKPETVLNILPYALGFMLLFDVYLNIRQTLKLRKINHTFAWSAFAVAMVTLVVGLLFIFNPFKSMSALALFMGIGLIFDGVSNICIIFFLSRALKKGTLPPHA